MNWPSEKPLTVGELTAHEAAQAHLRIAHARIAHLAEGGRYLPPEPLFDLNLHLALALEKLDCLSRKGAPDDWVENVRQYASDCARLLTVAGCEAASRAVPA